MALLTEWTWVWASFRRWWRIGKAGVLQPMGSQKVRHDWMTKQQQKGFNKQDNPSYAHSQDACTLSGFACAAQHNVLNIFSFQILILDKIWEHTFSSSRKYARSCFPWYSLSFHSLLLISGPWILRKVKLSMSYVLKQIKPEWYS